MGTELSDQGIGPIKRQIEELIAAAASNPERSEALLGEALAELQRAVNRPDSLDSDSRQAMKGQASAPFYGDERPWPQNDGLLEAILAGTPSVMVLVDGDRRVRQVNRAGAAFAERSSDEMLGVRAGEALRCLRALDDPRGCGFGPACERCVVRQTVLDTLATGQAHAGVRAALTLARESESEEIQLLVSSTPVELVGESMALVCLGDVTALTNAERALHESHERFEALFEQAPLPYQSLDAEGHFLAVNQAWLDALGYEQEEVLGRWFGDFLPPDSQDKLRENFPRFKAVGEAHGVEFEMLRKDGSCILTSFEGKIGYDDGGRFKQTHCVFQDVTECRRAEQRMHLLSSMVEQAADGIVHTDTEFRITYANEAAQKLFGWSLEEIVGKTPDLFNVDPNSAQTQTELYAAVSSGQTYLGEALNRRKDGSTFLCQYKVSPILNPEGRIVGYMGSQRDVTERKRAEEKLQESERCVRAKLDAVLTPEGDLGTLELTDVVDVQAIQSIMDEFHAVTCIGIAVLDLKGNILVATGWQDICTEFHRRHPRTVQNCLDSDTVLSAGVEPGDFKLYRCHNGMYDIATPIVVGGRHLGNLFLGQFFFEDEPPAREAFRVQARRYAFDEDAYLEALDRVPRWSRETVDHVMRFYTQFANLITRLSYGNLRLAQTLEALRETKEYTENIIRSMADMLVVVSPDGKIATVNDAACESLGYRQDELIGQPATLLFSEEEEEEEEEEDIAQRILSEHALPVKRTVLSRLVREGVVRNIEKTLRGKGGDEIPVLLSGSILRDEEHMIRGIVCLALDISERKKAEETKAQLEEQLRQSQKLEAVGQLAGGVAHDFNNLLTVITGYSEWLERAVAKDDNAAQALEGIREAAGQASGVTRSLLTFSSRVPTEKERVELRALIQKTMRMLQRMVPASISIAADPPDEPPVWLYADGTQLQQIIMNLVINARDAMPDGGTVRISIRELSDPATETAECDYAATDTPVNRFVQLIVSDTGTGMSAEIRERVFEPFFTTKTRGQGTGLGLAIVHGIVADHGGRTEVDSAPGEGTIFTITLPVVDGEEPGTVERQVRSERGGQGELVLLAEDNWNVRSIIGTALRNSGFRVLEAADGRTLMQSYGEHRDDVRLLVFDVDLPIRSGLDCLREIRGRGANVPAIVITGGVEAQIEDDSDAFTALLRKPFSMSELQKLAADFVASRRREADA